LGSVQLVVPDERFDEKLEALCRKTLRMARGRIEKAERARAGGLSAGAALYGPVSARRADTWAFKKPFRSTHRGYARPMQWRLLFNDERTSP